jgi:hypothetical protein
MFGPIKNLFTKFSQKPQPPTHDFALSFAFNCEGVDYFEFVDKNNLPFERGLEALTFFQEMQNGVTNEYLLQHVEAVKKIYSDPRKVNINEAVKLNARLEERLKFIISKDIIYRVASVCFVDKSENLLKYDFEYNKKKIEAWKRSGNAFFLSAPIKKLIPLLEKSGEFSLTYLEIVQKIESIELDLAELQMLEKELSKEND